MLIDADIVKWETDEAQDEEEQEQKPVIFNVLDAADDGEHEARDWFLNGNEVISSARRSRSSTFDDIRIDEFTDEVIVLLQWPPSPFLVLLLFVIHIMYRESTTLHFAFYGKYYCGVTKAVLVRFSSKG